MRHPQSVLAWQALGQYHLITLSVVIRIMTARRNLSSSIESPITKQRYVKFFGHPVYKRYTLPPGRMQLSLGRVSLCAALLSGSPKDKDLHSQLYVPLQPSHCSEFESLSLQLESFVCSHRVRELSILCTACHSTGHRSWPGLSYLKWDY